MKLHPSRAWKLRDFALLSIMLGVGLWVHRQPLLDIITIGVRDEEQSHIFLAPIVAALLLWLRRSRLRYVQLNPSFLGPVVVLAGWVLSWWGFESGTQIAWHGGAVLSLLGIVLSMTGAAPLMMFGPVLAVLVFFLPVPGQLRHQIALPLQELATTVTHTVLQLVGVGAIKSGNVLIINGQEVAVGEACNGMRMVFALTLVVYAFAFATPLRGNARALLITLSPVIAMLCNVIRLVPTSLIFGYGSVHTAQQFHDISGWVMLPIALLILIAVLRMVRWLEFPVHSFRLASQ